MSVQEDIAKAQAEAARLNSLLGLFPDLTQETNRWRRVYQCSKSVNGTATDYEVAYTCGCCPDPGMLVRVYVETPHGRVYGVPHQVEVGARIDGTDRPHWHWKRTLQTCGVTDSIMEKLQAYFAVHERLRADRQDHDDYE